MDMADTSDSRDVLLNQLADEFAARRRAGERPRIEEYCERHPDLAEEIRSVFPALVELERAKSDAGPELAVEVADAPPVTNLGDFRLLREVGRGGMGVVYEAEQVSLGRRVALKLLPTDVFRDPVKRRRFEREAKAAAKLHHTNIVPVHGFGEHEGTPYYVMQFIPGLGLDAVISELGRSPAGGRTREPTTPPSSGQAVLSVALAHSLLGAEEAGTQGWDGAAGDAPTVTSAGGATPDPAPLSRPDRGSSVSLSTSGVLLPGQSGSGVGGSTGRRTTYWESVARIGVQVAGALAYAHKLGVLHRDIKPANLLLDLDGTVWVADFGLAKADDSDDLTHTGDVLGTLRYLPPEAFEGRADARGDVYSLGLTLFELVALRPAYAERDRNRLVKQVTTGDPPRLRKLRRDAPRDLVTIVEKAIDKDPARRYQTAGALTDDLQRFLDGRPITARRATELERLWMWARRRPATAGLVAALFLCLLAGSVISTVFAVRADGFARDAELREKEATTARDTARRNADEAQEARNAAARQAAGLLLDRGIEDARAGEPARALHLFVRALRALPADDPQAAPLERVIRANLSAWAETVPALEHVWPGGVRFEDVAFSPDGEVIALAVGKDEIQCFRTDTGRPIGPSFKVPVHQGAPMVFAPDGKSLWVGSPGRGKAPDPGAVHRFDPATGRPIQPPIPTAGPAVCLLATPDGRYLVGTISELHPGDRGGENDADRTRRWRTASIVVWEAETGLAVRTEPVNAERDYATAGTCPDAYLSLSPDGKFVTAWVERGVNRFEGLTFSVAGKEPPIRWELPEVRSDAPWKIHFDNNMRTGLVIKDGQLHRWSASEPGVLGPGIATPFRSMHYGPSADGRSVISVTEGRVFDTGAWPPRPTGVRFAHPGWQRSPAPWAAQSPDGRFTATWIWQTESDRRLWRLPRPHSRPALPPAEAARQPERPTDHLFAQFDPRGTCVALWANGREWSGQQASGIRDVCLVDVETGAVRKTSIRHSAWVREVVFTPDGRYFATGSFDGTARVWETATGRPAGPPLRHTNYVATVAFSPDGNTLAAGDYGPAGLIKLWDWRTGNEVRPPLRHDDIVLSVTFSPDGRYLAAIKAPDWSKNPEILVWEVASGTAVIRMQHSGPSFLLREQIRFRPDGRVITTRDLNGVLRLWELPSGKLLGEPRPLDGDGVTRFSPDGRVVAAAGNLGVRLLDGDTLAPLPAGYLPHPDPITDVAFSPDAALLLTAHETGSAQLWDVATRKPVGPPAVLIGPIRAVTFTPDGKTCTCVAADGTVRRWPVPAPFAEPNLDRLADRVALLTGQRMDDNKGLDSVPAEEWRALRAKLMGDGSTALVPPRPDPDWHDAVAADAEQDGDSYGAEWHLNRLAKQRPTDWMVPARRGRVLARAGRTDEAAAAYDQAARLARSPRDLADWLRAAAADDQAAGRYDLGLWNLDRAVKLTPEDWVPYAARAELADRAGHHDRAAADIDTAIRLGAESTVIVQAAERAAPRATQPADWARVAALLATAAKDPSLPIEDRSHLALASLKAGDRAGYRAACAGIAGKMPPAGAPLFLGDTLAATKAFALGSGATDDWSVPLSWADRVLIRIAEREAADPTQKDRLRSLRQLFLHARGAILYRAGRPKEAVDALREGVSLHPDGGEFPDWVFLALAEHRLGHADAAKEAAAKARAAQAKIKPGTSWDRAEVELLAADLDATLPPPGK
jgi:serine/threonine protein kinase/WD40 repeat protein/Flp pilus assembly protein TadD